MLDKPRTKSSITILKYTEHLVTRCQNEHHCIVKRISLVKLVIVKIIKVCLL